jgi:hypothetical protein
LIAVRDELRELMAAAPSEFVATRTRLARAGARDVAKVRKPALKLWTANRAVTERPDAAERLDAATRRLRQLESAIAGGEKRAGAELRQAAADQKRELDVLESEAAKHARGAAAEAREIIRRAAVGGGDAWADLRDGVLFEEPAAPEESVFGLEAAVLPKPDQRRATEEAEQRQRRAEAQRLRAEADRLALEAADLEEQARRARSRADSAAARAADAEGRVRPGRSLR